MISEYQRGVLSIILDGSYCLGMEKDSKDVYFLSSKGPSENKVRINSFNILLKNGLIEHCGVKNNFDCFRISERGRNLTGPRSQDIFRIFTNNGFKVREVRDIFELKIPVQFATDFCSILNIPDAVKYIMATYSYETVPGKKYFILVIQDKKGTYYIGTRDNYTGNVTTESVPDFKTLKSSLEGIFDLIMINEMDIENPDDAYY